MAATDQPPKKRKIYEATQDPSSPTPHPNAFHPAPPPPPSQEEIIRKRRNKDEIRNLVDCYRRIKFCTSRKDARLMPELEQAYLALITASRGCTSVQRIVAELIPRYASFCPTALEAAAKVSINMYNWSLSTILRGVDVDGVAFETAKACIFGLVDICCTASIEAPTSSVIQGICSAVFANILTFFVSTFEGKDIYKICRREIVKLQQPMDFLHHLKHDTKDDTQPPLPRLFMLRALGLLCIFFAFPKNLLAACFELLVSGGTDVALHRGGQYFLNQVTSHLDGDENEIDYVLNRTADDPSNCPNSAGASIESDRKDQIESAAKDHTPGKTLLQSKNSFMGMAIKNDLSLKDWIVSYCRKLCRLHGLHATSELFSTLENVLGSLLKLVDGADFEESDRDHTVAPDAADAQTGDGDSAEKSVGQYVRSSPPLFSHEPKAALRDVSSIHEGEVLVTTRKLNSSTYEYLGLDKTSGAKDLITNQSFSGTGKDSDTGESYNTGTKPQSRTSDLGMTACVSGCKLLVKHLDASVPDVEFVNAFSRFGGITGWQFDRPNHCCYIDFRSHEAGDFAKSHLNGARFGATTIEVVVMNGNIGHASNAMLFSPRVPTLQVASADDCKAQTSQLSSLISSLCVKYNLNQKFSNDSNKNYSLSMNDQEPAIILYITLLGSPSTPFEDDDLRNLCILAAGNSGSVVRLTRVGMQNSCWFVEFSSVEAAATALENLRSCPEIFLLVEFRNNRASVYHGEPLTPRKLNALRYSPSPGEFLSAGIESKSGNLYAKSLANWPDLGAHIPVSPRVHVEKPIHMQHRQPFQSSWTVTSSADTREMSMDVSFQGPATNTCDRNWHYMTQENEPQMFGKGSIPSRPNIAHGGSTIPPPVPSSLMRPMYLTSNSWDSSGASPLLSRPPPGMMIKDHHNVSARAPAPVPFIPSSITPLSQLPSSITPLSQLPRGTVQQRLDQVVAIPPLPNVVPPRPPPSDVAVAPPLLLSPPPLPLSQPPSVPPPPSSPPPQQQSLDSKLQVSVPIYHRWQGTLTKSGVHYCTIYAIREDSVACKYSNTLSEPTDWPARLDVTKRTDIQHVKSTYANIPPHKREVCRLLPSTTSDQRGIQDFTSYLKQRDCAGVIKISAGKSLWARLLFILPYSLETCSLLTIAPQPAECLIALILPKEVNQE